MLIKFLYEMDSRNTLGSNDNPESRVDNYLET